MKYTRHSMNRTSPISVMTVIFRIYSLKNSLTDDLRLESRTSKKRPRLLLRDL